MKPLDSVELLSIWEEGLDQPILEKTLRLLSKACAGIDLNETARLSIGDRDARLLQLREWIFGSRLKNMINCPNCTEIIEWETNTKDLHLQAILPELSVKTFHLEKNGFIIHFRLPDSHDVVRAMSDEAYLSDHRKILADCILEVSREGKKIIIDDLPDPIWDELNHSMGEQDPQADIRMKIKCPSCSQYLEASFDIVSFLWAEINNWAQRIMREIGLLAGSFGWSEKDILSMSTRRRQLYIEMLGT